MKELITLDEANRRANIKYQPKPDVIRTGIACPTCKAEMSRRGGDVITVYASDPPMVDIWCDECGRRDYLTI